MARMEQVTRRSARRAPEAWDKDNWAYAGYRYLLGVRIDVLRAGGIVFDPPIFAWGLTAAHAERRVTRKVFDRLQGRRSRSWMPEDDES